MITEEQRIAIIDLLMNDDISLIKTTLADGDYDFITSILSGCGWKQYDQLSDKQIVSELMDRNLFGKANLNGMGIECITDDLILSIAEEGKKEGVLYFEVSVSDLKKEVA